MIMIMIANMKINQGTKKIYSRIKGWGKKEKKSTAITSIY